MNQPTRFQLSRRRGYRMPEHGRSVARPSRWGNPWRLGQTYTWKSNLPLPFQRPTSRDLTPANTRAYRVITATRQDAVEWYRLYLLAFPHLMELARAELGGRDLGCWCDLPEPGQPDLCHGDTLLRVANGGQP